MPDYTSIASGFENRIGDMYSSRALIKKLFENGDFTFVLQPILCTKSHRSVGGEVLLRYVDRTGELHSPYFLTAFERVGASDVIDTIVLDMVHNWVRQLECDLDLKLSVNLMPSSFLSPAIIEQVLSLKDTMRLKNGTLCIEVNENQMWMGDGAYRDAFDRLRERGIRLGLDDFGAGSSNLVNLLQYDFDFIKLDASLTSLEAIRAKPNLLKVIRSIADSFGSTIVAEGVEHTEQYDLFKEHSVDYCQGYFISKPLAPNDFLEFRR